MAPNRPAGWKNYDDFAAGIATNRLPRSDALVGQTLRVNLPGILLTLQPRSGDRVDWREEGTRSGSGSDGYEAIAVAADT